MKHDSAWNNVISVLDLNEETKQIGFVKLAGRQPVKIPANTMKVVQRSARRNKSTTPCTAIIQAISSENGSLLNRLQTTDPIKIL